MPPRGSSFTPAADRFLRSTGRIADKGFNALVRQNQRVSQYWQTSSSLWGGLQSLGLNCASISMNVRSMRRTNLNLEHFLAYGRYPNILVRGLSWIRDMVILYPMDVLWAFLMPILLSLFCGLLTIVLVIAANVIFFGALYLLLTS